MIDGLRAGAIMNCGSRDFTCYLLGLLASYGVELSNLAKMLPWMGELITNHAQAIIGLLGFSFGIWKWWRFHERVLHKRLKEYLRLQDQRLTEARAYIVDALNKPSEDRKFAEPLFSVRALRKVLRRRDWEPVLRVRSLDTSADRHLDKALRQLEHRLEAADGQLRTLRHQQASAYMLKAAIASARAGQTPSGPTAQKLDYRALDMFRAAIQVPGHDGDLELLEFEAHQLVRLGYLPEADLRLGDLENRIGSIKEPRRRDLTLARLKRARAQIAQVQAVQRFNSSQQQTKAAPIAWGLIRDNDSPPGALHLRSKHAPFQKWDALEQADTHYLAAFIAHNQQFNLQSARHLAAAETEYRRALNDVSRLKWLTSQQCRRLHAAADAGLKRVQSASATDQGGPVFDEAWLLPPSHPLERPSTSKSGTGGDKPVEQAASDGEIEKPRLP